MNSKNTSMINKERIYDITFQYFSALNSGTIGLFEEENNITERVVKAFNGLDEISKHIINNDFFYETYKEWWKECYPKSSYYRYKKIAMERFLKNYDSQTI